MNTVNTYCPACATKLDKYIRSGESCPKCGTDYCLQCAKDGGLCPDCLDEISEDMND